MDGTRADDSGGAADPAIRPGRGRSLGAFTHGPRRAVVVVVAVGLAVLGSSVSAWATFDGQTSTGANAFSTAVLAPPSGLSAQPGACRAGGALGTIFARRVSAATGGQTSATQLSIGTPLNLTAGDVLVAGILLHSHGNSGTIVPPAGWAGSVEAEGEHLYSGLFWRVWQPGDPAANTFVNTTGDTGRQMIGEIIAFANVDGVAPVEGEAASAYPTGFVESPQIIAPSVTTTGAARRLVSTFGTFEPIMVAGNLDMSTTAMSTHGTLTGAMTAFAMADVAVPTAGPSGTHAATSPSAVTAVTQSLALRPATVGVEDAALAWTATPSTFADGYRLQRWNGAALENEQVIVPHSVATAGDGPLTAGTTYTYRLVATRDNWTSTTVSTTFRPTTC